MSDLKEKTVIDVFEAVWEIEPATRKEIVAKSGWSELTVDKALRLLQEKGEVARITGRGGPQGTGCGRVPSLYMVTRTEAARAAAIQQSAASRAAA